MSYDEISKVKACMFDQYGTLVDMQGGFTSRPFQKSVGLDT